MPEISKEEARKRLEDSVKKVNWITHFLENNMNQDNFLEIYRGLHAQLREGDNLEIKANPFVSEGRRYDPDVPTAHFDIILLTKDGKRVNVYRKSTTFETGSGSLLYKD